MDLFRLHAFTVQPSRTAEASVPPAGGEVRVSKELTNVLNQNVRVARLDQRTLVDFQVDPVTRTNETRKLVLSYAFGDSQAADTAADSLALRLSNAMDFRSKVALFVLSALQEDPQRTVILWIFPRDEAFQFYYPDNLEALTREGARLIEVSPLRERAVPEVDALYIGGGFPETAAPELSQNTAFLESLRGAIERGLPVYAECGGFMYLTEGINDFDGNFYPMAGVFPFNANMTRGRMRLGYREAVLEEDSILGKKGDRMRGHEFHYSTIVDGLDKIDTAFNVLRGKSYSNGREGFICGKGEA